MKKCHHEGPTFNLCRGSWGPTLNFEGVPGAPLLNFEGVPGPEVPAPEVLVPLLHHASHMRIFQNLKGVSI